MKVNDKRNRSSNFTTEEELHLVQEIQKVKHILECKTSNAISPAQKEAAWNDLCTTFNSYNRPRNVSQLKSKYDNLKTAGRKYWSNNKACRLVTGGGPPLIKDVKSVIYDIIIDILNKKTVIGMSNSYDDDASVTQTISENVIVEFVESSSCSNSYSATAATAEESTSDADHTPACPPSEPKPVCLPSTSRQMSNFPSAVEISQAASSTGTIVEKWSSYTPKMLKKRPSKKLTVNQPCAKLTNLKEEYIKMKMASLEDESQERNKRLRMDEEQHQKRMELLELEIELKRKQL